MFHAILLRNKYKIKSNVLQGKKWYFGKKFGNIWFVKVLMLLFCIEMVENTKRQQNVNFRNWQISLKGKKCRET